MLFLYTIFHTFTFHIFTFFIVIFLIAATYNGNSSLHTRSLAEFYDTRSLVEFYDTL